MLVDEADIYMEQRKVQDLERNHMVAGFLRALEYYQGILFLTTNRVGIFDEAFISRIHIMIHYPAFDDKSRAEVWESFFRKLQTEREGKMRILEETRDYVTEKEVRELEWNGREIGNGESTRLRCGMSIPDKVVQHFKSLLPWPRSRMIAMQKGASKSSGATSGQPSACLITSSRTSESFTRRTKPRELLHGAIGMIPLARSNPKSDPTSSSMAVRRKCGKRLHFPSMIFSSDPTALLQ